MKLASMINAFRPAEGPPPQTLMAFVRWALRGAFPVLGLATILAIATGFTEVATAFLLGTVIDTALETGPQDFFAQKWPLVIGFVCFFLFARPILMAASAAMNSIVLTPNLNMLVLSRLHRWTLGQSVTFFDEDFAGRIAQKQVQTASALTSVAVDTINVMTYALASILGSAALLALIDWRIGLSLAIWMVLYLALIHWFMPRIRAKSRARAGARSAVTGQVVDTITNIKTVKLFSLSDHEDREALNAMETFRDKALGFGVTSAQFRLSLTTLAGTLPVLLVGGALLLWSNGGATAGDIAAAGTIAIRIAQMTGWVSFSLMAIYSHVGEVEDGMNTLSPPHTLVDVPGANDLPSVDGEVRFEGVSFTYGRDVGGVRDVSLTIAPGEKLGIVGASGAGKSTLVAALLRLYDTEKGAILIDGHDVSKVTQESLRSQIGMVTQEAAMFNRSARDNILYGNPAASDEQMIAAAQQARAHEFIEDLQDKQERRGYDAHLGERGVKLSGGQRQRIALARAFLKNAPILVLDEATSALDSEVEALIQEALSEVMDGKTVLAIAHRLSTIKQMDRIIVLDEGRIVEQGSHTELLAIGGLYARYWERQSGGFIGLDPEELCDEPAVVNG